MIRYLLLFLLLIPSFVSAGWQQIAKIPAPIGCCFFLNDNVGFAGTGSFERAHLTPLQIWVTVNGGYSWTQATTPSGVGQVTQIAIDANGFGYASIFSRGNYSLNRWRTTDGGYSWIDASVPGTNGTGIASDGSRATWSQNVIANQNTNGIFSYPGIGTLITPGPNSSGLPGECWSAYGEGTDNIWFAVQEMNRRLMYKLPSAGWAPRFDFAPLIGSSYATGHIHGKLGVMYIQTESRGMVRTSLLDSGKTWVLVGGPSNNIDTRSFWVMGCKGEVVIAFDASGGVWKTTDGGSGMSANAPIVWEEIKFPNISACTTSTKSAKLLNTQCGNMVLTSVAIENNPGVYIFTSPALPDTLFEGESYTATVDLIPNGNYGVFNSQIRIKGYIDASGNKRNFDSVIKISASINGENPRLTLNLSTLDLGDAGICGEKKDSVFIFKNTGCDTLEIISGPGTLASEFSIDAITLPYSLPPDSSVTIGAHFIPVTLGKKTVYPSYIGRMHGKTQEISFQIEGTGTDGVGVLGYEPKAFSFDTLSICSLSDSLFGFLTNTGCVPITIENFALTSVSDYVLLGANPTGAILQPEDTLRYGIQFSPLQKGTRTGAVSIRSKNTSGTGSSKDHSASITGFVGNGTKLLSVSPNGGTVDLGTVFLCDETNSSITLENTGCDTLILTSANLVGTGFTIDISQLPITLAPDQSITLGVSTKVDTTGGKTQNSASVSFASTASNTLPSVSFIRSISFPGTASFGITSVPHPSNPIGTSGDPVRFALVESATQGFTNANIRSLEFDLGYNSDLITYTGTQGPNTLTTSDNRHFTLSGSPYIQADGSGTLAELDFRIYLTKDSTTDLVLSNVTSGGGSQDPCASSISTTTGASFTYTYLCADHMLQDFMRGETLQLGAIKPNPAKDDISFVIEIPIEDDVKFAITDVNGTVLIRDVRTLQSGKQELTFSINDLPEGSYILSVESVSSKTSQRFVRVK
ncbi:MAG TPA: choice-of-anchor D domain-containing protein [Candidatus Kapabacteria bacterium]